MFNERFNPTPVIIEWFDINATDGGWHSEEDIKKHEPAKCIDLCFIYSESDDRVITFSSCNCDMITFKLAFSSFIISNVLLYCSS